MLSCSSSLKPKGDLNDQKIEEMLSIHRQYAFMDLYKKALEREQEQYGISDDALLDLSSVQLYHEFCLPLDFYSDDHPSYVDENYVILINKWLEKEYKAYMPVDDKNLKTHMTFRRVFDFYESEDLDRYIDSLRTLFQKKYKKHTLKSLDCFTRQKEIWEQMEF